MDHTLQVEWRAEELPLERRPQEKSLSTVAQMESLEKDPIIS